MLPPPPALNPKDSVDFPSYLYDSTDARPTMMNRSQDSDQQSTHIEVQMPGAPSQDIQELSAAMQTEDGKDFKNVNYTLNSDDDEVPATEAVISVGLDEYTDAGSSQISLQRIIEEAKRDSNEELCFSLPKIQ